MKTEEAWLQILEKAKKNETLYSKLIDVHIGAISNIRENGDKLLIAENINDLKKEETLEIIRKAGNTLISSWPTSPFDMYFSLKATDSFPYCIFIVLILFLNSLDGVIDQVQNEKIPVHIQYKTDKENEDFGSLVPLISEVYPWVEVSVKVQKTGKSTNPTFVSGILNSLEKFLSDIFY